MVGWIPFTIGDIADGLNALISFLRGNVLMGIINIVCLALPAAIMAGAKQIGKACSNAVEFISKISPSAQKMVKTVTGFITGMRDAIGKIIWLAGEKVIRPIMNKLDDFGKWVGDIFSKGASGVIEKINAENLKYSKSAWYDNRPYQKSTITIQNIIDSLSPGTDPKGSTGLWWKVDGVFNGSQGTYELLISPDKTTIWHFLFRSK